MISDQRIDSGKVFDWGRASGDYARYRDIYPEEFYDRIAAEGLCTKGQRVLDLGTGTGVLPRNMYRHGALFTGTDIAENQIKEAIRLSQEAGMDIAYQCCAAETLEYAANSFDVVTACQCFFYFQHEVIAEKLYSLLKPGGKLVILYMAWLPFEDPVAGESEKLILKYNPAWSGCGEVRRIIGIPDIYKNFFEVEKETVYDLQVPFTRATWNGRMRACRGIGASLTEEKITQFSREHAELLDRIAPVEFGVLHYAAMSILKVKNL